MKKIYEKPVVEKIHFDVNELIMDINIGGGNGTVSGSIDEDFFG